MNGISRILGEHRTKAECSYVLFLLGSAVPMASCPTLWVYLYLRARINHLAADWEILTLQLSPSNTVQTTSGPLTLVTTTHHSLTVGLFCIELSYLLMTYGNRHFDFLSKVTPSHCAKWVTSGELSCYSWSRPSYRLDWQTWHLLTLCFGSHCILRAFCPPSTVTRTKNTLESKESSTGLCSLDCISHILVSYIKVIALLLC